MIDKQFLEAELAELRKQIQEHLDNINAVQGAIQYCQSLINKLDKESSASLAEQSQDTKPQLVSPTKARRKKCPT